MNQIKYFIRSESSCLEYVTLVKVENGIAIRHSNEPQLFSIYSELLDAVFWDYLLSEQMD